MARPLARAWSVAYQTGVRIGTADPGAVPGHGLAQQTTAATQVQHLFAGDRTMPLDVFQPDRINDMERAQGTCRIPPVSGMLSEGIV